MKVSIPQGRFAVLPETFRTYTGNPGLGSTSYYVKHEGAFRKLDGVTSRVLLPEDPGQLYNQNGWIDTSSHDVYGDSDCNHVKVEGNIVLLPDDYDCDSYEMLSDDFKTIGRQLLGFNQGIVESAGIRDWKRIRSDFFAVDGGRICLTGGQCVYKPQDESLQIYPATVTLESTSKFDVNTGTDDFTLSNVYYLNVETYDSYTGEKTTVEYKYIWYKRRTQGYHDKLYKYVKNSKGVYEFVRSWLKISIVYIDSPDVDQNWLLRIPRYVDAYSTQLRIADYSSLAIKALDAIKLLDINTISYIKEAIEMPEFASGSVDAAEGLFHGKVASAYLIIRYGYMLTAADTKELQTESTKLWNQLASSYSKYYNAAVPQSAPSWLYKLDLILAKLAMDTKLDWLKSRYRTGVGHSIHPHLGNQMETRSFMLRYRPRDCTIARVYRTLSVLDANPTSFETIWDLIPFSFVVDWFTEAGDRLASLDRQSFEHTLETLGSICSVKTIFPSIPPKLISSLLGRKSANNLIATTYRRQRYSTVPDIAAAQDEGAPSNYYFIVDGFFLILQSKH